MTTEANLWEWLRDVALPLGQYSRIESGDTAPGFPDVHYQLGPGVCGTIELKHARDPKAKIPFTDKRGMRRSQRRWITENIRCGGVVWIIAQLDPKHIVIIDGHLANQINGSTREDLLTVAEHVLSREDPEEAAEVLEDILFVGAVK